MSIAIETVWDGTPSMYYTSTVFIYDMNVTMQMVKRMCFVKSHEAFGDISTRMSILNVMLQKLLEAIQ